MAAKQAHAPQPSSSILSAAFVRDSSELLVLRRGGFQLYDVDQACRSLAGAELRDQIRFIEKAGPGPLIAVVFSDFSHTVFLRQVKTFSSLGNRYQFRVKLVKTTPHHLGVVTERHVLLYRLDSGARVAKLHHRVSEVRPAHLALQDSSCQAARLAFPKSNQDRRVQFFETGSEQEVTHIAADTGLAALSFSPEGRTLAVASTKGVVIRVWALPSFEIQGEFCRSMDSTTVHCLSFSPCSTYLAAVSDKAMLYVFKVGLTEEEAWEKEREKEREKEQQRQREMMLESSACRLHRAGLPAGPVARAACSAVARLLSRLDISMERPIANIHLPESEESVPKTCDFRVSDQKMVVNVATHAGNVYKVLFTPAETTKMTLLESHSLVIGHQSESESTQQEGRESHPTGGESATQQEGRESHPTGGESAVQQVETRSTQQEGRESHSTGESATQQVETRSTQQEGRESHSTGESATQQEGRECHPTGESGTQQEGAESIQQEGAESTEQGE